MQPEQPVSDARDQNCRLCQQDGEQPMPFGWRMCSEMRDARCHFPSQYGGYPPDVILEQ